MTVVKQTKKQAADAIRKTRTAIEARIVAALSEHQKTEHELALRKVAVGRLLAEYRETFFLPGVTTKEATAAFNVQADRIVPQWGYAMRQRVMQAARVADAIPAAAVVCNDSVEALKELDRIAPEKAAEIVAAAEKKGEVLTAAAIKTAADTTPPAEKKKQTRDAANRKALQISESIAKDLDKMLRASAKFAPEVRLAIVAAMILGSKWQYGPETPNVVKISVRKWNENATKAKQA